MSVRTDFDATADEKRCADALDRPGLMEGEGYRGEEERRLRVVRAVIDALRSVPDSEEAWKAFAGDGKLWKERNSQDVFRRYLDIASPPITHEVVNVVTKVGPLPKNRAAK